MFRRKSGPGSAEKPEPGKGPGAKDDKAEPKKGPGAKDEKAEPREMPAPSKAPGSAKPKEDGPGAKKPEPKKA